MMKRFPLALLAPIILAAALLFGVPVHAQFADQATLLTSVGSSGGGNTVTATLAPSLTSYNSANGVLLKLVPNASNTGAATLNLNSLGTSPAIVKMTSSGLTALTGTGCELVNGVPALLIYLTSVSEFVLLSNSCSNISVGSANLLNSAMGFNMPLNMTIGTSVGSNQLTLSICANSSTLPTCTPPSATNPIIIPFRDVTVANGDPVFVSLTAALSFTINSGNTMGCTSAVACHLRIYLINNGGTLALCAYNSLSGTSVVGINEGTLQTSQSGTSGGSSGQSLYCSTSAVSAKAVREIGYIEVTETTAGTWASLPTFTQLMGPGVLKAGQWVQMVTGNSTGTSTTTSATFAAVGGTLNITPTSAANVIEVESSGSWLVSTAAAAALQITHTISASTTLIGNPYALTQGSGTNVGSGIQLKVFDVPNTLTAVTYGTQGKTSAGTLSYPPASSGIITSAVEIMTSLDHAVPANDDEPLRKVA